MSEKEFRSTFRSAKRAGKKTFTYGGKRFTTETASERAKKLTDKQLEQARMKAYSDAKAKGRFDKEGKQTKGLSQARVYDSYANEQSSRRKKK